MATVRNAVVEDTRQMAVVRVETWRCAYAGLVPDSLLDGLSVEGSAERFFEAISAFPTVRVAVVEEEHRVLGFSLSGPCRGEDCHGRGEIYALYVLPEHQGRGIGTALFEAAISELAARELLPVEIRVLAGNPYTRFYEKHRCRLVGERLEELEGVSLLLKVYVADGEDAR